MKYTATVQFTIQVSQRYKQTCGNFIGDMSSLSGSEVESENEDDAGTSETGTSSNEQTKNESSSKSSSTAIGKSRKTSERRGRTIESDVSDTEYNDEMSKERKLQAVASRHTKVFFENDDGNIFSIYRCLLHHKKVRRH